MWNRQESLWHWRQPPHCVRANMQQNTSSTVKQSRLLDSHIYLYFNSILLSESWQQALLLIRLLLWLPAINIHYCYSRVQIIWLQSSVVMLSAPVVIWTDDSRWTVWPIFVLNDGDGNWHVCVEVIPTVLLIFSSFCLTLHVAYI